jgi:hypothetical protein
MSPDEFDSFLTYLYLFGNKYKLSGFLDAGDRLHLASVDGGIIIFYRSCTILYPHIRAQVYRTYITVEFVLVPHIVVSTREFWRTHGWRELVKLFSYGVCLALT